MAAKKPGLSMFSLGALIGLVFSVALAILLSVANPVPPGGILASDAPPLTTAAAPASPVPVAPAPDDPKNDAPAPQPAAATEPEPAAEETAEEEVAAPEPTAEDTPAEVAAAPEDEVEPTPGPAPVESGAFVDDAEAVAPAPARAPVEPRGVADDEAPALVAANDATTPAVADPAEEPRPAPATTPDPVSGASPAAPPLVTAALETNAERFDGDPARPMLAIVLDGVGAESDQWGDVLLLPAPMTVVVAAADAEAGAIVSAARDSGFEAMLSLSAGDLTGDGAGAVLDTAASVIGVAATGDLDDVESLKQLSGALALRGMGLLDLTADGGGASFRVAQREGLPSAAGGRRFDAAPSSAAVYQALERAAFDARRLGAFVVVGAPSPQVMTGLRRWMNVKAGKSVTLAPLSAVLEKFSR